MYIELNIQLIIDLFIYLRQVIHARLLLRYDDNYEETMI